MTTHQLTNALLGGIAVTLLNISYKLTQILEILR